MAQGATLVQLMPGLPYTAEHRETALSLYVEEGPDIAAERTGISVRTIYRWASADGVSTTATSERTQAATTAAKARAAMVRAELGALLVEQAVKALHSMDEQQPHLVTVIEGWTRSQSYEMTPADANDKKNLALTAAILIEKFRLEQGEPTARYESRDATSDLNDHERDLLNDAIRGELARRTDEGSSVDAVGVPAPTGADPADG